MRQTTPLEDIYMAAELNGYTLKTEETDTGLKHTFIDPDGEEQGYAQVKNGVTSWEMSDHLNDLVTTFTEDRDIILES